VKRERKNRDKKQRKTVENRGKTEENSNKNSPKSEKLFALLSPTC
jgi:hypothetical protein